MPLSLTQYPDRFLNCRAIGHMWNSLGLPWVEQQQDIAGLSVPVVYEKFVCARCAMARIDQRTTFGRLLRRHYNQPERYRLDMETRSKETHAAERFRRILGNQIQQAV